MAKINKKDFVPAKRHIEVEPGEALKILRDLKGWTQKELALRSGVADTNISLLERGHVEMGKRRAEKLAKAFGVSPRILLFPEDRRISA